MTENKVFPLHIATKVSWMIIDYDTLDNGHFSFKGLNLLHSKDMVEGSHLT